MARRRVVAGATALTQPLDHGTPVRPVYVAAVLELG